MVKIESIGKISNHILWTLHGLSKEEGPITITLGARVLTLYEVVTLLLPKEVKSLENTLIPLCLPIKMDSS